MDTEKKRAMEAEVMSMMIGIYCRGHHHANRSAASESEPSLCPDCRRLCPQPYHGMPAHGCQVVLLCLSRPLL